METQQDSCEANGQRASRVQPEAFKAILLSKLDLFRSLPLTETNNFFRSLVLEAEMESLPRLLENGLTASFLTGSRPHPPPRSPGGCPYGQGPLLSLTIRPSGSHLLCPRGNTSTKKLGPGQGDTSFEATPWNAQLPR